MSSASPNQPVPHYRLRFRFEPASHRLEAEAWIRHAPSSRFYLNGGLNVRYVSADDKPVPFRTDLSAPRLPYTAGRAIVTEAGSGAALHISYGGDIPEIVNGVNLVAADLVELACYSGWYPAFEGLFEHTYELEANLPQGFVAVTNGRKQGYRERAGRSVHSWTSFRPGFDIALIASPKLKSLERERKGNKAELYFCEMPVQVLNRKTDKLLQAMERLSAWYGSPRTPGIVRLAYSPRAGWGYARTPLIVISEQRALRELARTDGEARDFRDNCHEMAHFWWMVADPATPDDWLNEAAAEFSAFRLVRELFGETFAQLRLSEYRQNATRNKTAVPIAATENNSPDREINRYDKGALLLIGAQSRYGTQVLDGVLRTFHLRFAGTGRATTAGFLEEVGKQIGQDARGFFAAELYRKPSATAGK